MRFTFSKKYSGKLVINKLVNWKKLQVKKLQKKVINLRKNWQKHLLLPVIFQGLRL